MTYKKDTGKGLVTTPQAKWGFLLENSMPLVMTWKDIEGLEKFGTAIKNMDKNIAKAAVRALNRTGDSARVKIKRELAKQTGLKQKVLVRALKAKKANFSSLGYEIYSKGGDISLKYFSPRETRSGVSAAPFRKRSVFKSTFMLGGQFPNRHGLVGNGHVFIRGGKTAKSMTRVKSGVIIPNEMVKGESREAFEKSVREVLPKRMEHELSRLGL